MKKMRKGKKMLLILLAVIIVIIAIVVILNTINKQPTGPETPDDEDVVISLPETTYSNMEVRNVYMEYLKENDQTKISMEIDNVTENTVEDEWLTVVWVGEDGTVLNEMETWIQELKSGEQYKMQVIENGDLTSTTQIKLIEK